MHSNRRHRLGQRSTTTCGGHRLLGALSGSVAAGLLGLLLTLGVGHTDVGSAEAAPGGGPGAAQATCPTTTPAENLALARAWHEDVINQRNPTVLQDILASQVVHHAAGGYPSTMTAAGVAAMMDDFLVAFSDLRYTFDLLLVSDDYVVQRYTATGTHDGPLQNMPASGRRATWTGINIFRIECGRIAEVWSEVNALSRNQQLTAAPTATPTR